MQSEIQREILLLSEIDEIKGTEAIKVLSICSHVLGCSDYEEKMTELLGHIFNSPDFDLMAEISHVVLAIVKFNQKTNYYKLVAVDRMKYVLYATLLHYMLKHNLDYFNNMDIGKFRLLYCNSWSLLSTDPKMVEILKETCVQCINRKTKWFSCCCDEDIHIK